MKKRPTLYFLVFVVGMTLVLAQAPSPTPSPTPAPSPTESSVSDITFPPGYVLSKEGDYVPGKLIVKLRDGISIYDTKINDLNYKYGLKC